MKTIILLISCAMALTASAVDITRNVTFTDGQRLTAANLHSLIDSATIGYQFYTSKSAETTLDGTDTLLVYSSVLGAYRKITANSFLYQNTAFVTALTEKANPSQLDSLLIYDVTGTVFKKATIYDLFIGTTNLYGAAPLLTNTVAATSLVFVNDGTNNGAVPLSSIVSLVPVAPTVTFTNLPTDTTITNGDAILIWDSLSGSNRQTTLAGLFTNSTAAPTATNGDLYLVYSPTNGGWRSVNFGQILYSITNAIPAPPTFTAQLGNLNSLGIGGGTIVATNHGLGGLPRFVQWTIVCTNADGTYNVGDELDLAYQNDSNNRGRFSSMRTATNVTLIGSSDSGTVQAYIKSGGSAGDDFNINVLKWCYKVYATR